VLLAEALVSGGGLAGVLPHAVTGAGPARALVPVVLVLTAVALGAAAHGLIRGAPVRTKAG
jgi:hypothetical protein